MSDYLTPPSSLEAAMLMAPELSEPERKFRDAFVAEYVKDYDWTAATIRMGFAAQYAPDYAKKMMFDSYVRKKIAEREESDDYTQNPDAQKREVFKLLKREATFNGHGATHSARVAALGKLADFLGMNAPVKTEQKVEHSGGVQFYIPHNERDPLPTEEKAS